MSASTTASLLSALACLVWPATSDARCRAFHDLEVSPPSGSRVPAEFTVVLAKTGGVANWRFSATDESGATLPIRFVVDTGDGSRTSVRLGIDGRHARRVQLTGDHTDLGRHGRGRPQMVRFEYEIAPLAPTTQPSSVTAVSTRRGHSEGGGGVEIELGGEHVDRYVLRWATDASAWAAGERRSLVLISHGLCDAHGCPPAPGPPGVDRPTHGVLLGHGRCGPQTFSWSSSSIIATLSALELDGTERLVTPRPLELVKPTVIP